MSAHILSGIEARDASLPALIKKLRSIKSQAGLAIIQVGDRSDSTAYIGAKISFARKYGVAVFHAHLPEKATEEQILQKIEEYNLDQLVHGIIVQLPLPEGLDRDRVINTILPSKDIDGLTEANIKLLVDKNPKAIIPATVRGVMELLKYYQIGIREKKVTIVGRSALVGRPMAEILSEKGALVTVAHSKTIDLASATKEADIIIVAVGKAGLIGREHVKKGQIIIDVGINRAKNTIEAEGRKMKSNLVGDVDFEAVKDIVAAITPVPGGVGPMTVLGLFENLADAY